MANKVTFQEIIEKSTKLQRLFAKLEIRKWTIETFVIEFLAEAGTLADSISIKEGYRKARPSQSIDLEDDISDLLFMILIIAAHYDIDIKKSYLLMVEDKIKKLEKKLKKKNKT